MSQLDLQLKISANTTAAIAQLSALGAKASSLFNNLRTPDPTAELQSGTAKALASVNALAASMRSLSAAPGVADKTAVMREGMKLTVDASGKLVNELGKVVSTPQGKDITVSMREGAKLSVDALGRLRTENGRLASQSKITVGSGLGEIAPQANKAKTSIQGLSSSLLSVRSLYALAAGEAARFVYNAAKGADDAARSFTALGLAAKAAGISASAAADVTSRLAADGRITKQEATDAVSTLLTSGQKDLAFIEQYLSTLKDFSALFGSKNMSLGQSVTSVATAIKTGNSATLDNSGIPTNASVYLDQYARSIGTVATSLTQAEQSAAIAKGTLTDMQKLMGNSGGTTTQFSSAVGSLKTSFSSFSNEVGSAVTPAIFALSKIASFTLDVFTKVAKAINSSTDALHDYLFESKKAKAIVPPPVPPASLGASPNVPSRTGNQPAGLPPQIQLDANGRPVGPLPAIPAASKSTPELPAIGTNPGESLGDFQIRKKRESERLDQSKKIAEALSDAEVKTKQATLSKEDVAIADALARRKITGVDAAKQQGNNETLAKLESFKNLQAKLTAVDTALTQNQDGTGKPFDINREVDLRSQKAQLLADSLSLGDEIEAGRIKNATDIYSAEVSLAKESSDIRSAKIAAAIEVGQTNFQANLEFEKAKLDQGLESQLVSQREFIEKTKQLKLTEIAEQNRQNTLRLQDSQQKLSATPASDPVQRAQLRTDIEKLNADIAASTQRRATAETESLTKVLQLEESIKQARTSLAQEQASLIGQPFQEQLKSIAESVRQFNKQFAGEEDAMVSLRAQKASNAQLQVAKATFDEQKRLIDERASFETVAIERINLARDSGAISSRQAEKDTQSEKLKTIGIIEENVKALEALAAASAGNKSLALIAEQARVAFERLRLEGLDPLATSLNRTVSDSIGQRIQDWTSGTLKWGDALRSVFTDIFGDLAKRSLKRFTDDLFNSFEDAKNPSSKQGLGGVLAGLFDTSSLGGLLTKLFSSLKSGLSGVFSGLSLGGGAAGAGAGGGFISGLGSLLGFATGGPVFGAGSGTSDSIIAKLSHGEFVMTARAHQKWGTGFLAAINAGVMPNFNMPAFATGGPASEIFGGAGGATNVNVTNQNTARLYLDPAHVASEIGRQPQFGRDVIAIVLANKGKLGM